MVIESQRVSEKGARRYVKQRAAREAQDRFESQVDEAQKAKGLPTFARTTSLTEELYDRMSRAAHNRRSSCVASLNEPTRRMTYGIQTDPLRRGTTAAWAAGMTAEVINSVGDSLRALYGVENYFAVEIAPLYHALEAVRDQFRLDPESLYEDAGLAAT